MTTAQQTAKVAERLGISAATLKKWNKAGIVTARQVARPLRPAAKTATGEPRGDQH